MNSTTQAAALEMSWAGPVMFFSGLGGMVAWVALHLFGVRQRLWGTRRAPAGEPPGWTDRLFVHLAVMGAWGAGFGAMILRGPPAPGWDVRLPGEANWPVWADAEWIYVTAYLTPLSLAWLAPTRGALRRLALRLGGLSVIGFALFLLLPVASPARAAEICGGAWARRLLSLDLGRADFAATSLPSFHVFWAFLTASVLAERGAAWRPWARVWPFVMSLACVLNGAHAVLDVAASWLIWAFVKERLVPDAERSRIASAEDKESAQQSQ